MDAKVSKDLKTQYFYNKKQNQISFGGIPQKAAKLITDMELAPSKAFIKSKKFPIMESLAFVTALISAVGFGVGGSGLIYDFFRVGNNGKKNKNKNSLENPNSIFQKIKGSEFQSFRESYIKLHNAAATSGKNSKKEEVGRIEPETRFGKIGMIFAKIGVGFSGIAGAFSGLVMRLPLMALGQATNVAAAPILDTPTGFGLMSIGLSAIFAGWALEKDPSLKLNPVMLASKKGLVSKTGYVISNIMGGVKEVGKSTKTVFKNLFNLAIRSKRKEAAEFMRDHIFAIRSRTVEVSEKLLADGSKAFETVMKSSPYRMHAASAILAIGGALIVGATMLKNKFGQKLGFKASEIGGSLDNISLSMQGLETVMRGNPGSGIPMAIAGAAILAGQPHIDKKDGRGIQWLGCAALFLYFFVERGRDLSKAFKEAKKIEKGELMPQIKELARTWEIPLPKGISMKKLRPYLTDIGRAIKLDGDDVKASGGVFKWLGKQMRGITEKLNKKEITLKEAKKARKEAANIANAKDAMINDPNVKPIIELVDTVKGVLKKGLYNPDTKAVQKEINDALTAQGEGVSKFAGHVAHGSVGDYKMVLESIHNENSRIAGKEGYLPILDKILANKTQYNRSKTGKTVLAEAEKARKNLAG